MFRANLKHGVSYKIEDVILVFQCQQRNLENKIVPPLAIRQQRRCSGW